MYKLGMPRSFWQRWLWDQMSFRANGDSVSAAVERVLMLDKETKQKLASVATPAIAAAAAARSAQMDIKQFVEDNDAQFKQIMKGALRIHPAAWRESPTKRTTDFGRLSVRTVHEHGRVLCRVQTSTRPCSTTRNRLHWKRNASSTSTSAKTGSTGRRRGRTCCGGGAAPRSTLPPRAHKIRTPRPCHPRSLCQARFEWGKEDEKIALQKLDQIRALIEERKASQLSPEDQEALTSCRPSATTPSLE